MASLTHTGGKPPAPSPVARKSLFERSRCDTSLGLLTQGFAELLHRSADGVLDLNVVTQKLNAPKRRVYDVTNVLEGVKLLKKKSKNTIQWLGGQETSLAEELKSLTEEEKYLDELIQSCTLQIHQLFEDRYNQRYAYLTYEDVNQISSLKEQTVFVIKAPPETNLEVPHPEESLQVHLRSTQGPIEVFLCSDDPIPMEVTDSSAASGKASVSPLSSFTQVSSKDVANNSCRINNSSNPLSEQTQHSSPVIFTAVSPTPATPSSEDQHSFVTLAPSLAISHDEEQYLLSLAEDEGITDLFSSVDLDQAPVDMPLV
ncbi:transcription factor E2F3 [Amphiprion ocellaris]|uniref:transcription factor E2F3 n=1 Tax=Amphiprion ocellaris TaxID=80972 RepID=UPI000C300B81|nr:transcription factor E2F3 [Amphiprion ocellaris]XP_054873834.1 transcription factor E2F3 [Amphiprion ocellaris]XP_054873835.1 transcription factor E2F3 [Amphiprion ocellaris]XP_054873836.1 transcription factor E2F3 [Amphiprion ocellaris]